MLRCFLICLVIILTIEEHVSGKTTKQMTPEIHKFEQYSSEEWNARHRDKNRFLVQRRTADKTNSYYNGGREDSAPSLHTNFKMASSQTSNKTAELIKWVNNLSVESFIKRVINGAARGKKGGSRERLEVVKEDPEPVVFVLESGDLIPDFISNSEVIEEYRRSRKKKKKKKNKDASTSSEEKSDSDGLEYYRRKNSRVKKITPNDEETLNEEERNGIDEGVNYDEKSDDYILTKTSSSKRDVWDYEHEDWVVTNKISWDDVHDSKETSEERKKRERDQIEKEHEQFFQQRDRFKDQLIDEHKQTPFKKEKLKFKDELIDEQVQTPHKKDTMWDQPGLVHIEPFRKHKPTRRKTYEYDDIPDGAYSERKEFNFNQKRHSEENTGKKYYNDDKNGDDQWSRPNSNKNSKTGPGKQSQKDYYDDYGREGYNTKPTPYWEKSGPDLHRRDKPRQGYGMADDKDYGSGRPNRPGYGGPEKDYEPVKPKRPNYETADKDYGPIKPHRPGYVMPGKDYDDYKGKYVPTDANYVDNWGKQNDKKKPDKHNYDYDYREPRKPNNEHGKWDNSKEKNFNHKSNRESGREKYHDDEDLNDMEGKRHVNSGRERPLEHLEPQRSVSSRFSQYDPRLEGEAREQEDSPRYNKKSQLRHETLQKDWETGKMDWNDRSREERQPSKNKNWSREKQDQRGNEMFKNQQLLWQKNERKPKKINRNSQVEDFWNRHAHNNWDKVGVGRDKRTTEQKRFTLSIRTTDRKEIFDRHKNNDWDKVGMKREFNSGGDWAEEEGRGHGVGRGGRGGGGRDGPVPEREGERGIRDEMGPRMPPHMPPRDDIRPVKAPPPDYQEKVSFESKPQSQRNKPSQEENVTPFFGYVHTPLAFKEKKTVFD